MFIIAKLQSWRRVQELVEHGLRNDLENYDLLQCWQEVQDAISSGDLSNFMEAMGISTNDVWTA